MESHTYCGSYPNLGIQVFISCDKLRYYAKYDGFGSSDTIGCGESAVKAIGSLIAEENDKKEISHALAEDGNDAYVSVREYSNMNIEVLYSSVDGFIATYKKCPENWIISGIGDTIKEAVGELMVATEGMKAVEKEDEELELAKINIQKDKLRKLYNEQLDKAKIRNTKCAVEYMSKKFELYLPPEAFTQDAGGNWYIDMGWDGTSE